MIQSSKQKFWDTALSSDFIYGQFEGSEIKDFIKKGYIMSPVLDYGCGRGELMKQMRNEGLEVAGMDISEVGINITRENLGDKVKLIHGDYESIEGMYKTITCKLVYAFVDEKEEFLQKVKDHLMDGGTFVLSTPVINDHNRASVVKPGICVSEEECSLLRSYFDDVILVSEKQTQNGDMRVYVCFK